MYTKETTNLLERYSLAKQSGFQAAECAFPYAFTKEELAKVQSEAGLQQILLNTDPGASLGFAALVNHEQKFMDSLQKSIDYCQAVNCQKLHIMSGKVTDDVQASIQVLKDNLKKAAPLLQKAGIVGLIEPINPYWVPNYFLNDFDIAEEIIKEINHPNLKLMLDIFHLQYLKGNLSNNIPKVNFSVKLICLYKRNTVMHSRFDRFFLHVSADADYRSCTNRSSTHKTRTEF